VFSNTIRFSQGSIFYFNPGCVELGVSFHQYQASLGAGLGAIHYNQWEIHLKYEVEITDSTGSSMLPAQPSRDVTSIGDVPSTKTLLVRAPFDIDGVSGILYQTNVLK